MQCKLHKMIVYLVRAQIPSRLDNVVITYQAVAYHNFFPQDKSYFMLLKLTTICTKVFPLLQQTFQNNTFNRS